MAHPLGPPPSPLAGCQPRTLPRALRGLPTLSAAQPRVASGGQECPRVQPGARRQVAGRRPPWAAPRTWAASGRSRAAARPGSTLPILQGSGHCRQPGTRASWEPGVGVEGDPAAGGEVPVPATRALQVRSAAACALDQGGSDARSRAVGRQRGGEGAEEGGEGGAAGGWGGGERGRQGEARRAGRGAGRARCGPVALGALAGGPRPDSPALEARPRAPQVAPERERPEPGVEANPRRGRRDPCDRALPRG